MSGTTPLSDFQYTYNAVGTIATWQQQTDSSTPNVYTLTYDNGDRLTNAPLTNTATQAQITTSGYNYDPVGNRLVRKFYGGGDTAMPYNNLNQLTGLSSNVASTAVAGHTSAAASSVTIDGAATTLSHGTNFSANVYLPAGTNTLSVVAQPSGTGGSITTQRYQVVTTGTAPTMLSYDLNGNCTVDQSGNSYQWDALNRLTKITYPSGASSLFAYDGLSRRVQIVEKNSSGTVTSTKNHLWIGSEIAEERNTSNIVQKRFFPQGEQQSGTNYYYTRDHLGSVREMVSSTGTISARYSYDPYGNVSLVSGSNLATEQFAGYYYHSPSTLYLTKYRAYDESTGRWLSRDPMGEGKDATLYSYVWNRPTSMVDPLGLWGVFVFYAGTAAQGGVAAEGIQVGGWDSSTGFYTEQITAFGGEAGTKAFSGGFLRGTAATHSGSCPTKVEGINLMEGNLPLAGSGGFRTDSGETGPFVDTGITDFDHSGMFIGAGGTLPDSVTNAWSSAMNAFADFMDQAFTY